MLSGLLYPTSGEARVLGHVPSRRETAFLRQITMVMGNRNQLQWDLPALDSFELIRAIYRLDPDDFRRTRDEFIELLDLGRPGQQAGAQPVARRADEGGDRRRAAAPAAGAVPRRADDRARRDHAEADPRRSSPSTTSAIGATVLLTSHYMADVQALCRRVIVIHHGRILFDGALAALAARFTRPRRSASSLKEGTADLSRVRRGDLTRRRQGDAARRRAPTRREVTTRLLRDLPVADLTIEDPPIEDVIERVFADATEDHDRAVAEAAVSGR